MTSDASPQHPPDRPAGGGPQRPPDHDGTFARIWAVKLPDTWPEPAQAATLQAWLIHAPLSHPFWPWYMLAVIHLRDIPDVEPAYRHFPEATHELIVAALNPEVPLPDPDSWIDSRVSLLSPTDQIVQFTVPDDTAARRLGDLAVLGVASGTLIPDQDHRQLWLEAVTLTAEHLRIGGHG